MSQLLEQHKLTDLSKIQLSKQYRIGILATEWNATIVTELINGAQTILSAFKNVSHDLFYVPGSVELVNATYQLVTTQKYDAIIDFGVVIRGDTPHFDYVCDAVTQGLTQLNASQDTPIIFGVLTVNTIEQAIERIGGTHGHKGEEAAITALKMIAFKEKINQ